MGKKGDYLGPWKEDIHPEKYLLDGWISGYSRILHTKNINALLDTQRNLSGWLPRELFTGYPRELSRPMAKSE
jgi:hypothetical protein